MEKQSEALELAKWLYSLEYAEAHDAADELRRLHAENAQLLEALEPFVTAGSNYDKDDVLRGRAVIAAARSSDETSNTNP